jgi:GTP-binding protein Era
MPTSRSDGPEAEKSQRKAPRPGSKGKAAAPASKGERAPAKGTSKPERRGNGPRKASAHDDVKAAGGKRGKRLGKPMREAAARNEAKAGGREKELVPAWKTVDAPTQGKRSKASADGKPAKGERAGKPSRAAGDGKASKFAKTDASTKPSKFVKSDAPAKPSKFAKSDAPAKPSKFVKTDAPAKVAARPKLTSDVSKKSEKPRLAVNRTPAPVVDESEADDLEAIEGAPVERTPKRRRPIEPVTEGPFKAGTVAIIGRPNVGKSTLVNALLGENLTIVSSRPQTTRDAILGVRTLGKRQLAVLDTPGLHKTGSRLGTHMNAAVSEAVERADLVLFVTEPPVKGSGVRSADREILERLKPGAKVVLGLNKVDEIAPKERLLPMLKSLSEVREFVEIVPFSARDEDNVDRLFTVLAELLPEGEPLFDEETLTDRPMRFFAAEYVREQLLRKIRDEIPHGVGVIVDSWDSRPTLDHIEMTVLVARESHKPIVLGAGGEMLTLIGSQARARLEKLTGRQAVLKIFVRVEPGWFDRADRLRDLGYVTDVSTERPLVDPS